VARKNNTSKSSGEEGNISRLIEEVMKEQQREENVGFTSQELAEKLDTSTCTARVYIKQGMKEGKIRRGRKVKVEAISGAMRPTPTYIWEG